MTWWLKKLLRSYRDEAGCPPPAEPDWEEPCRLCRWTDSVLAEAYRPLDWGVDAPLVAEVRTGTYASVESRADGQWSWRIEGESGWELRLLVEGTAQSLAEALYAVEEAAHTHKA